MMSTRILAGRPDAIRTDRETVREAQSTTGDLAGFGRALLAQADTLDLSRMHARRFNLPNLTIEAWFSDPAYAELCAGNLANGCSPEAQGQPDLTLYLLDSASAGWPPPPRWMHEVYDRQAANAELGQAGLRGAYLHDPRVWQFYSESARTGIQLVRRPGAMPAWESGGPLRAFLHWAYAAQQCRLCHAATLGVDGQGILLVGAGGSGKSGTCLAGIANGLDTVGDDYCLVGQDEAMTAYPLFRMLKQDPAGVTRALGEQVGSGFGTPNWQGKYEIHASMLARQPFVPQLEIRAIVVPRVAHAGSSAFRPIQPGLAMRSFAPSSAFQLPDGEHEVIAFAGVLCRRLPCFELELSVDAREIAGEIHAFLERLD
jgi:hypothetical protein